MSSSSVGFGSRGDADAGGYAGRQCATVAERPCRQRDVEPFCRLERSRRVGLGQQERELIAAVPRCQVDRACLRAEHFGYGTQDVVSCGVAEGVVDPLEVVDVDQRDGERTV